MMQLEVVSLDNKLTEALDQPPNISLKHKWRHLISFFMSVDTWIKHGDRL